MIRVRYRGSDELSLGLHATAERDGRRTTVYLIDGMTAGQLAFALTTSRIRTGIGRAARVLRLHPAGSTVPIMVLSGGAIAFLLFSTVSIHVIRPGIRARRHSLGDGPGPVGLGVGLARQRRLRERGPARGCLNI